MVCKEKIHATGCSKDDDICTPTFLSQFKSARTNAKYATSPGNFVFMCNPCLTGLEVNMAATNADKVGDLKSKVDGLEESLNEIKKILLNSQVEPLPQQTLHLPTATGMKKTI